jgi:hypothetical protein
MWSCWDWRLHGCSTRGGGRCSTGAAGIWPTRSLATTWRRRDSDRRRGCRVVHRADGFTILCHRGLLRGTLYAVSEVEADLLVATGADWGLSSERIAQAHRDYLSALIEAAWADTVVCDAERRELFAVGFWLGVDEPEVTKLVSARQACATNAPPLARRRLVGLSVCFTGQLTCSQNGRPITRGAAHRLATQAGLTVAERVTKNLDLLVVADPHTQSGKARKARDYGTRILAEPAFWRLLGINVD